MKSSIKIFYASLLTLGILFQAGCSKQEGHSNVLNLYIWSDYISDKILNEFSAQTGIKVHFDTYDSNEALLAKLQSGVSDYDIIVPSDYTVKVMISEKLL